MRTATESIRQIGQTTSIEELNSAYNDAMLETERLAVEGAFDGGDLSVSEIIATINHLTNYNIVRVANKALEDYEASGRTDKSRLIEIVLCRDSIKEHEDSGTETALLNNLCSQFGIE